MKQEPACAFGGEGVFKIVGEQDVERLTSSGWTLVDVTEEEQLSPVDEPMTADERDRQYQQMTSGRGYNHVDAQGNHVPQGVHRRTVVVRRKRYILKKDIGSVVAASEERAARAAAETERLRTELNEERKGHAAAKSLATTHESNLVVARQQSEMWQKQCQDQSSGKQKMERDLAKVRQAVGEIRMKEILGQ